MTDEDAPSDRPRSTDTEVEDTRWDDTRADDTRATDTRWDDTRADDTRADDSAADDGSADRVSNEEGRTELDGSWTGSTATNEAGVDPAGDAAEAGPAGDAAGVDPAVEQAVVDDLAALEEDDADLPAMDDPIDPQGIDVENAAFVTLGALAMVALVAHMLLGFF